MTYTQPCPQAWQRPHPPPHWGPKNTGWGTVNSMVCEGYILAYAPSEVGIAVLPSQFLPVVHDIIVCIFTLISLQLKKKKCNIWYISCPFRVNNFLEGMTGNTGSTKVTFCLALSIEASRPMVLFPSQPTVSLAQLLTSKHISTLNCKPDHIVWETHAKIPEQSFGLMQSKHLTTGIFYCTENLNQQGEEFPLRRTWLWGIILLHFPAKIWWVHNWTSSPTMDWTGDPPGAADSILLLKNVQIDTSQKAQWSWKAYGVKTWAYL